MFFSKRNKDRKFDDAFFRYMVSSPGFLIKLPVYHQYERTHFEFPELTFQITGNPSIFLYMLQRIRNSCSKTLLLDFSPVPIYCDFVMEHREYRLAAIMYTDICGFSRMMEKNEDETLELLEFHNKMLNNLVDEHRGQVLKTIGDAYLASFNNTFDAVKCAVQIQHELASYNSTKQGLQLILRIGIHLGDIYFFENDALGEGINIASRLQSLTKPGRICISKEVHNIVSNKLDLDIVPLGKVELKNITRDIQAFEIITESSMEYEKSRGEREQDSEYAAAGEAEAEKASTAGDQSTRQSSQRQEALDINEVKEFVVDHIRDAGRRMRADKLEHDIPNHSRDKLDRALHTLVEKGYLTKLKSSTGEVSYGLSDSSRYHRYHKHRGQRAKEEQREDHEYEPAPFLLFRRYKKKITKQAEKERNDFRTHFITYLAVNGFLFFLNMTTGVAFPWFLFPLGGWGIGIITHFNSVRQLLKQKEELDTMPELTPTQLRLLKRIHKLESSFSSHLVSNIAVALFLFMINMITSPGFPWFLFPTAGMGIGVISHWASYSGKKRKLKRELKRQIQETPIAQYGGETGTGKDIVYQAETLKNAISEQIKNQGKENTPLGEDMLPLLDNYLKQIRELAGKKQELESVMQGFPEHNLEKDNRELKKKQSETDSEMMKQEYQRSIEEIEKQMHSFNELKNQKELIGLRLTSAVNSLKQMQIDLARMRSITASNDISSVHLIKEKSRELSHYLHDLETSYRELGDASG